MTKKRLQLSFIILALLLPLLAACGTPAETETEAEAEANAPDGGMSGDVPPEADSAPTDDGKEAHDAPAMPDTADAAEEETASAAPDRTEKGAQDR